MTTMDVAMPGACRCGRIASEPHQCEYPPRPSSAGGPALRVPVQPCGVHLVGDVCDCPMAEAQWLLTGTLAVGIAEYGRR